jgi:hypothetical protein
MANITIKELLAADKVHELVDKINFNFDQLLLNGGGPIGLKGGPGIQGPLGPRGTIWFTAHDLWTTSDSPSWTGTPVKANNPLLPGYPQYKGDPNRFRPVAPTGVSVPTPWVYPEHTYTLNIPVKPVRGGDLFLQEGDDVFDLQASVDGDIWEYNASSAQWVFTGVNIKGNTGAAGVNSSSEWIRITASTDDLIYPKHVTGQDTTRVLMGQYSDVFKMDNSTAVLTINTDATHIALNHPAIHSELVNPGDEELGAYISVTSTGDLVISGAAAGSQKQIFITSSDSNINMLAGGTNFLTYQLDPTASVFNFQGGAIEVFHPNVAGLKHVKYTSQTGATTSRILTQKFDDVQKFVGISGTADGYGALNQQNAPHIILQSDADSILKNVGIGYFNPSELPQSKLGVKGSLSIGATYGSLLSPDTSGAIIEGRVGIGTPIFPSFSTHKLQVNSTIVIGDPLQGLQDNLYYDTLSAEWKNIYAGSSWMMRQDASPSQANDALYIYVYPHSSTPGTPRTVDNYLTLDQRPGTALGKLGVGVPAWYLDSRVTINDTDGSGLHFIRANNLTSSADFYGGLNTGSRIWNTAQAHVLPNDEFIDKRFNIHQYEDSDIVIGNSIWYNDGFQFSRVDKPRIIVKYNSGFVGINTFRPKHNFTVKGYDNITEPELNSATPLTNTAVFDPDEVNMGTFEDRPITGLTVNTIPTFGNVIHTSTNIQGASYVGFNAWFSNTNGGEVIYGDAEAPQAGNAGAIFFADRNGNFHWANLEESYMGAQPGGGGGGGGQQFGGN